MFYCGSNFSFQSRYDIKNFRENHLNSYRAKKKKNAKSSYIHLLIQNLNVIVPKQKKKQFDKTKKKKGKKDSSNVNVSTFKKFPIIISYPRPGGGGARKKKREKENIFKKQAHVQAYTLLSLQNSHSSHPSLLTQSLVQVQDQEGFHSIHQDDTVYDQHSRPTNFVLL